MGSLIHCHGSGHTPRDSTKCAGILKPFPLEHGLVGALGKVNANVPHLLEGVLDLLPRIKLLAYALHVPHPYKKPQDPTRTPCGSHLADS